MLNREREVVVRLTPEEAWELFSRCLKSADEDNAASREALRKLAAVLERAEPVRQAS
jgi:hypothetical protein